ncbi:MAG TPA: alpha-amylase family glycosyl hydrolase [Candidatus Binatia bacterium]|jgi:alpha-amylase|nr:alpha-amylase family glycosyl hydrolase [Candidatus Binatia bacterium]
MKSAANNNSSLRWLLALLGFLPLCAGAQSVSNGFWQAQSIYQIITDRFFDGDPSNNNAEGTYNPSGSSGTSVHGGDFKGIEQKLDYIKALGATAIWISPVVLNANGEFHGYAARDFYTVAPHWGTLADLQHLVQTAHSRGILVIDDIVVNHGGDLIYSTDSGYPNFLAPPSGYNLRYRGSKQFAAPFNTNAINPSLTNLFHNYGNIQNFNISNQVVLGELSGLDDFRTESPYVRSNMAAVYQYWIGQVGFDGFRIDTVKHVDMGFWQNWCPLVHAYASGVGLPNFFMFGEVYDGSESKCGSYTGNQSGGGFELDSVLDYPLYFMVNSVFATASGNTKQIEDHYNAVAANYDPEAQMRLVTFLDNHDQPRFLSSGNANNNTNRLMVALAFLYTARGIPSLYYGTEQAFNGGGDPNDREDMFAGQFEQGPSVGDNFNMTHPLFQWVAKLNNFRRLYPALQVGSHVNKWNEPSGPGLFAYARRLGAEEVFVVFNTSGSTQTLTNRSTIFSAGTRIVNLFDTNEVLTVTSTPEIPPITVPGTTAKIFVAQSDWRPLDPVIVSNSPTHDSASVPTASPIVLQFSKPMDTNGVQAAFSTIPPVSGAFTWSATGDTLTFAAGGAGLPPLTNLLVRVTNTAVDAVSGNAMVAPYELRFKTAATGYVDTVPPTLALQSPTNGAVVAGNLVISGIASDNVAVQRVEIQLDSGPWVSVSGATAWSYTLNSSNFLNGPHLLAARATDTSGNISPTNVVGVRFFNVPGAYLQRLSGGNPANVTDCSNNVWLRDSAYSFGGFGYSGGATGYVANAISGICSSAQSLYQRERYSTSGGGFFYQFDCPEGLYETTMLEAETYWNGAGKRIFNVFIQGAPALTNFDIYAAAGGQNIPLSRIFTNTVTNSQLQVLFTPVVDNARISGLQVRKIADVFSDSDGIPDWWRLAWFGHPTGQASDQSRGMDDADGDGMSNLKEFLAGTNPLDPSSVFKITQALLAGSDVQASCSTVSNRTYQLQRRDSLYAAGSWSNIGSPVSGNGGALMLTDTGGATNTERYYRVQVR